MGRPRTVSADGLIRQFNIYISADDFDWLEQQSHAQSTSRTAIIRQLIRDARQEVR